MADKFYVYQLRRSDSNYPFYIGKGQDDRAWKHFKLDGCNPYKDNTIRKAAKEGVDVLVEVIVDGLTEDQAFRIEVWSIKLWGRKDKGEGPLTNLTDGGEGVVGHKHKEETKLILREIAILQWSDPIRRENWSQYKKDNPQPKVVWSEESKKAASDLMKGNTHRKGQTCSEEHKKRIGDSNRGRVPKEGKCLHCGKVCSLPMLGRWHNDKCKDKPNG